MVVVIIGCGSIGRRHAQNLLTLGYNDIYFYRNRGAGNDLGIREIKKLNQLKKINPDLILICTPTSNHFKYLEFCLKNDFNILCEKPLVNDISEFEKLAPLVNESSSTLRISFNLRYHPCIIKVREILKKGLLGKINYSRFFVGQYLPDWRPHLNHLDSYSANKDMGGGVLKDLIHEIDLSIFLNGPPVNKIQSLSLKVSDVTNDSDDVAEILFKSLNGGLTNIHLDYLYRGYKRYFILNGEKANLFCDLKTNQVIINNGDKKILEYQIIDFQKNSMYIDTVKEMINEIKFKKKSFLPDFFESRFAHNVCYNSINNDKR